MYLGGKRRWMPLISLLLRTGMSQRIVHVLFSFSVTVYGVCSYHLSATLMLYSLQIFQWMKEAVLLCLYMYSDFANSGQPLVT